MGRPSPGILPCYSKADLEWSQMVHDAHRFNDARNIRMAREATKAGTATPEQVQMLLAHLIDRQEAEAMAASLSNLPATHPIWGH